MTQEMTRKNASFCMKYNEIRMFLSSFMTRVFEPLREALHRTNQALLQALPRAMERHGHMPRRQSE